MNTSIHLDSSAEAMIHVLSDPDLSVLWRITYKLIWP